MTVIVICGPVKLSQMRMYLMDVILVITHRCIKNVSVPVALPATLSWSPCPASVLASGAFFSKSFSVRESMLLGELMAERSGDLFFGGHAYSVSSVT